MALCLVGRHPGWPVETPVGVKGASQMFRKLAKDEAAGTAVDIMVADAPAPSRGSEQEKGGRSGTVVSSSKEVLPGPMSPVESGLRE